MKISIIVPTLNAEPYIAEFLTALNHQNCSSEIIVIDSSSNDRTLSIAANLGAKTMVIDRSEFDHGGTRNLAARRARGDVLVFMTQDALPANERLIENLVKPLNDPAIAASFARQVPRKDATWPEKFTREFNYPDRSIVKNRNDLVTMGIKTFFFSDVCSAVRRADFDKVGGFPEPMIMNEDMVLAAKLVLGDKSIAYVPEAVVVHSHSYTIKQQFKRYFDIGASLSANRWILNYARPDNEGARLVKEQLRRLVQQNEWKWLPYILGDLAARYIGYKLGLNEARLPSSWKSKLSMHGYYWRKSGVKN